VGARTLAEKILLAHCDADSLAPGEIVLARCDVALVVDGTAAPAARVMRELGRTRVHDPAGVVAVADHYTPAASVFMAERQRALHAWARDQGVTSYGQGRGGIEHAVLAEEGWLVPGALVASQDSHTCTAGALGAYGAGLTLFDLAVALAFGEVWLEVPRTIRVELRGTLPPWVAGKDVVLALLAELGVSGALGCALEWDGPGVASLSVDDRLAVANMAVELGADTALFPADAVTAAYLEGRARSAWEPQRSDPGAEFARTVPIDLGRLGPLVAAPHSPGNVVALDEVAGVPVHQVYIGNCGNGTLSDLRQAAAVLAGRRVHPRTRAIVVPATVATYRAALAEGLVATFLDAGCVVAPPSCGACFGGHSGVLAAGETCVANTNRNFRGRMGSGDASVYLANSWVAAAAAVAGEIIHPSRTGEEPPR
jgi:3-isopropylmalate/(R)-2-methylmalate dehydratase large subunit